MKRWQLKNKTHESFFVFHQFVYFFMSMTILNKNNLNRFDFYLKGQVQKYFLQGRENIFVSSVWFNLFGDQVFG